MAINTPVIEAREQRQAKRLEMSFQQRCANARRDQAAMAWGALFIGLIFGLVLGGM